MQSEIETFLGRLYSQSSVECDKKPPLTYEAYGAALHKQVLKIKEHLTEIEVILMKQGKFERSLVHRIFL